MLIPSLSPHQPAGAGHQQNVSQRAEGLLRTGPEGTKPHIKLHLFPPFCYKTWFLYSKVKQSSYAKLALHKGEFNARLQSTDVSLMTNCLSKLKRKEQMIRYKKVLKAPTKGHFTNIISAALGLPAGWFRPGPAQL